MDTEAMNKINQIKQLLDKIYVKKKGKSSSGYVIGMFTTLQQTEVAWIDTELKQANEHVKDVRFVNIVNIKKKDFEKAISECTFCIYISTEEKWKSSSPSDRKKTFSLFGKKILVLLIIDMEDSSDEEKNRIVKDQPRIKDYVLDLFLLRRREEKTESPPSPVPDTEATTTLQGESSEKPIPAANLERYRNPSYRLPQPIPVTNGAGLQSTMSQRALDRKHIVCIFSRSAEEDYAWLVRLLNEAFQDFIGDVRSCCISDNGHQQLREDMAQCTFGILYHSKNRGRAIITDMTEALYDQELEALSAELGRKNMIVLIDDLRDSSEEERTKFLQAQPSIDRLACELILLSVSEKENKLKLTTKLKVLKFIFGGEYSGQKMLNAGKPTEMQNTETPTERPNTEKSDPPDLGNTASGAGNASPVLSRERIPIVVTSSSKSTVAIFSRSEESDYSWLTQLLSPGNLDVRSYKISSLNKDHPQEMAFQCRLAILYHNMHNGKLRLTDTKDAMYHEELEMLSTKFGKRRVIVVIDDLVKSDEKIKSEILERQPSTGRFVKDIFLFSVQEKKQLHKKDPSKDGRRLMDKIGVIKELLRK